MVGEKEDVGHPWVRVREKDNPDWLEYHLKFRSNHISVWIGQDMIYRTACVYPNGRGMVRNQTMLYKAFSMDEAKEMSIGWVESGFSAMPTY